MITGPEIQTRAAMPYVAIETEVAIADIPQVLPPLIPEVLLWLKNNNSYPAGAPFFNYLQMHGSQVKVAVGFPVSANLPGDDRVKLGSFPAGRYAVIRYQGPYENLFQVHTTLENWAKEQNIETHGAHAEFYLTDPETEPDTARWQTEIIRLIK